MEMKLLMKLMRWLDWRTVVKPLRLMWTALMLRMGQLRSLKHPEGRHNIEATETEM